jgi:hypothetical protein
MVGYKLVTDRCMKFEAKKFKKLRFQATNGGHMLATLAANNRKARPHIAYIL